MVPLSLEKRSEGPFRLLCLGAHCDDIEIGCGGAILKMAATIREMEVDWVVFSSSAQRKQEAMNCANAFLQQINKRKIQIHDYRDGFFPHIGAQLKECFERLKANVSPDLILTHYRNDLHQDHRLISELTWNTFRNHLILEYEIPKYDGDFGSPNVFVSLEGSECEKKIALILSSFPSQSGKRWFSRDLFSAMLRLRGMEANSASDYAEGFYCRKATLNLEI